MRSQNEIHGNKKICQSFSNPHKKDMCLVGAVLAAALISGFVFWHNSEKDRAKNTEGVLEVTVDGELYGRYPLNREQEIDVVTSYGKNTVVIEDDTAYVTEADCPDKICVGMQKISRDGEMICCLPHRLILTVRGTESAGYDAVAYDHDNVLRPVAVNYLFLLCFSIFCR